jgi:hypothetical protein
MRVGPMSVILLVVVIALDAMAVLAVTSARSNLIASNNQAVFCSATYDTETAAQELCAVVDSTLAAARQSGIDPVAYLSDNLPTNGIQRIDTTDLDIETSMDGNILSISISDDRQRTLTVELTVDIDGTYTITRWQTLGDWETG